MSMIVLSIALWSRIWSGCECGNFVRFAEVLERDSTWRSDSLRYYASFWDYYLRKPRFTTDPVTPEYFTEWHRGCKDWRIVWKSRRAPGVVRP